MIKEVTLPVNAKLLREISLPVPYNLGHPDFRVERSEHVQVVWHQQQKWNAPVMSLVIIASRSKDLRGNGWLAQLVQTARLGANSDEENRIARADEVRRIMGQRTASGFYIQ